MRLQSWSKGLAQLRPYAPICGLTSENISSDHGISKTRASYPEAELLPPLTVAPDVTPEPAPARVNAALTMWLAR